MRIRLLTLSLAIVPLPLAAADFGFSVVIRAGDAFFAGPRYEVGIGAVGSAPSMTLSLGTNFISSPGPRPFEIGYRNTTNTGYVRVYTAAGGPFQEITYSPVGGAIPTFNRRWELPGSAFFTQAQASVWGGSVTVDQLALSGALSVLQPLSGNSLTATNSGAGGLTNFASNTLFIDSGTGSGAAGNWAITGRITFSGFQTFFGGADRLRFGFGAEATNTPEPATYAMIGLGLLVFRFMYRRPRSHN